MTPWIIDASLAMNWYLTDEQDREYSISIFAALGQREILVPSLWIYEISNQNHLRKTTVSYFFFAARATGK